MNVPTEHWSVLLTGMLTFRLPATLANQWEQKRTQNQDPTFDQFMESLKQKIRGQNRGQLSWQASRKRVAEPPATNREAKQERRAPPAPNDPIRASGSRAAANKSSNEPRSNRPAAQRATRSQLACWQCGEAHLLYDCDQFVKANLNQRKTIMLALGVCLGCGRRHLGECNGPDCEKCPDQKHPRVLCPSVRPAPRESPNSAGGNRNAAPPANRNNNRRSGGNRKSN